MREICIFVKTFERIFILYMWKNIYCVFHKVPCYYDIEVQFVIIVNMQHLENCNDFIIFQTCHVKEAGLYNKVTEKRNVCILMVG